MQALPEIRPGNAYILQDDAEPHGQLGFGLAQGQGEVLLPVLADQMRGYGFNGAGIRRCGRAFRGALGRGFSGFLDRLSLGLGCLIRGLGAQPGRYLGEKSHGSSLLYIMTRTPPNPRTPRRQGLP